MGPADRPRLWLGNALGPQRPRPLVYGIVHGAQQRIRNRAFVKAHTGGVHLHELGIPVEGGIRTALGLIQHQAGRAGFSAARRAIDEHVLRIRAAEGRPQGPYPIPLADDVLHLGGPRTLG